MIRPCRCHFMPSNTEFHQWNPTEFSSHASVQLTLAAHAKDHSLSLDPESPDRSWEDRRPTRTGGNAQNALSSRRSTDEIDRDSVPLFVVDLSRCGLELRFTDPTASFG